MLQPLISYCLFYDKSGAPIPDEGQYAKGIDFVWGEAVEIERAFGSWVKFLFMIMGMAFLLTTEFGVLDASTRVSTDIVKVNWLRNNSVWTESRLYYTFLWGIIGIGTAILLYGMEEICAFALFKFAAAMNGGVMFLYCITLLVLNRFKLPPARLALAQTLDDALRLSSLMAMRKGMNKGMNQGMNKGMNKGMNQGMNMSLIHISEPTRHNASS